MRKEKKFRIAPSHKWRQNGKHKRNSKKIKDFDGNFLPMRPHFPDGWDDDYWVGSAKKMFTYLGRWFAKQTGRETDKVFGDFKRLVNWRSSKTMYQFWGNFYREPTDWRIDYYDTKYHGYWYTSDENGCLVDVGDLEIPRYTEEEEIYVAHNRAMLEKIPYYGEVFIDVRDTLLDRKVKKYGDREFYLGRFYVSNGKGGYVLRDLYHFMGEPPKDGGYEKVMYYPIGINRLEWQQNCYKEKLIRVYNWHTHSIDEYYGREEYGLGSFNDYYKK